MNITITTVGFIASFAFVGAFIDFTIGKAGQKKIRSWLESVWIGLSYREVRGFGEAEAREAAHLLERYLGRGFFSVQRFFALMCFSVVSFLFGFVFPSLYCSLHGINIVFGDASLFLWFLLYLVIFSASLSLTRIALYITAHLMTPGGRVWNFAVLVSSLTAFYAATCLWGPIVHLATMQGPSIVRYLELRADPSPKAQAKATIWFEKIILPPLKEATSLTKLHPGELLQGVEKIAWERWDDVQIRAFGVPAGTVSVSAFGPSTFLNYSAGSLRLGFFATFLLVSLLKPARTTILHLWARIVESDRPVFTLLFGALGTALKLFEQGLKLL